jgi:regulator of sigma E protease
MMAHLQSLIMIVAPFLAVITLIVTVHELGHFLVARAFGVAIERFSIGFGRALLSWRDRAGVEWRLAWAPLGGYVKFAGDANNASVPDVANLESLRAQIVAAEGLGAEHKYLPFKPLWQRALIVVAGPAANFLLAVVLFAAVFATFGHLSTPFSIAQVQPASAAAEAGFKVGDRVLAVDGHPVAGFLEFSQYVALRDRVNIDFTVLRSGRTLHLQATPRRVRAPSGFGGPQTRGQLGILEKPDGAWGYRRLGPFSALAAGAGETWSATGMTAFYLGRLVTGQVSPNELHGFVGMARYSGVITRQALGSAPTQPVREVVELVANLFLFAAFISVGIGLMNLMPVPVLDGGHLLFYAYEWIARRPVGARVQAAGYRVGLALLVGLMLFANLHDLPLSRVRHFFGNLLS